MAESRLNENRKESEDRLNENRKIAEDRLEAERKSNKYMLITMVSIIIIGFFAIFATIETIFLKG